MTALSLKNISKSFGVDEILRDVSFSLRDDTRLGLVGPNGTGKTTLVRTLKKRLPDLNFSISHTTRPPRENEQDGVDYYFIDKEKFTGMTDRSEFLEWAQIHDNCYGTALKNIEDTLQKGKDLVLELDVQGATTLRENNFPGIYIFLLPPSLAQLGKRLQGRGTEKEETIRKRLEVGKQEIPKYRLYDYVLTNYKVEDTVQGLLSIIKAENSRVERYQPTAKDIESLLTKANS